MLPEDVLDRLRLGGVAERRRRPVRVDVPDPLRFDVRPRERLAHHLRHTGRLRLGLRQVVRVVGRAVAEDLRVHLRPALLRRLQLLQHEDARALPHDEAGAQCVERTRGARWVLVLGCETSHRAEAGEDNRVHSGLGAAREYGVGVAATDQLRPLPYRRRARRARRHGGVVRPAVAERDGHLTRGGVGEHAGNEVRRHPVAAAVAQDVALLHDPGDAADRRAEEDAHAHRVVAPVERSIRYSLLRRRQREQHVPVQPPRLLHGDDGRWVEVLDLGGDAHGITARVERADEVDAAAPGDGGVPRLACGRAHRRDRSQARDDDASHDRSA